MQDFYNRTYLERTGVPMDRAFQTLLWSLTVSMFPLGGLFGSLLVWPMVNNCGRWVRGPALLWEQVMEFMGTPPCPAPQLPEIPPTAWGWGRWDEGEQLGSATRAVCPVGRDLWGSAMGWAGRQRGKKALGPHTRPSSCCSAFLRNFTWSWKPSLPAGKMWQLPFPP